MEWIAWIPTVISTILVAAIFIGKHAIKAGIEKSIQHEFDAKIEALRSEFHKKEEEFKSELRLKETQISALRDGVLSGRANRQALLDKRRLEAVERVWSAVNKLAPYMMISGHLAVINFDAVAKQAPDDPKLQAVIEAISSTAPDKWPADLGADERPFVSPMAWALFSAYQSILGTAVFLTKMLEIGTENPRKLIRIEVIKDLLKTALPDQAEFIDKNDIGAHHFLLGEIKNKLLAELTKTLEGVEADEEAISQSAKIMEAVEKFQAEAEMQKAKVGEPSAENSA